MTMTLTVKLVAVLTFTSIVATTAVKDFDVRKVDIRQPQDDYELPITEQYDSYNIYQPQLPLDFQLPKVAKNQVPFYVSEPEDYLKAPQENQEPNYYQVPIPAQELVAPVETAWNPNNDPKLYYEIPAVLSKQNLPTKEYPKKFHEQIHQKNKPYSLKPKQEITLQSIDEKQYQNKQKELQKIFQALAKNENQKQIQSDKAQQTI